MSKTIGCKLCMSEDYMKQGYTEIARSPINIANEEYTLELKLLDDRDMKTYLVKNSTGDPVAEATFNMLNYCPMCGRRLYMESQRINTLWKKKKEV